MPPVEDCRLHWERRGATLDVRLPESLDTVCVGPAWEPLLAAAFDADAIVIDADGTTTCDGAGLALLKTLMSRPGTKISGLDPSIDSLLQPFLKGEDSSERPEKTARKRPDPPMVSQVRAIGRLAHVFFSDVRDMIAFTGELVATLGVCVRHPGLIRWRDFFSTVERAGVNALLIVGVISLLTGMILAFQAMTALRQFGVEIFVVNLVALAMLREMGVIMTAVVLAGRSGSAFAAEIGTMKINEEIDALTIMGLDPVRFLIVPKVLAGLVIMPVLTLFADAMGVIGGLLVMRMEGYPLAALWHQLTGAVSINDLMVGLIKSFFFGLLVAAIGCLRGMQTGTGATAVGISTTRAVVSGIFLIVIADAIFSGVFYILNF